MNANLLTWEEAVQFLREQADKQELVRDCYYDDPLEIAAERFSLSEEWLEVEYLLKKYIPGKVLDIGAGRGISSYAFAKTGCTVTALEPDPSLLVGAGAIKSLVENTKLPIEVSQDYGETLPFKDNTFDIVYGRAILHHAQDLKQLCREASRVLKHGGIFIATREHVISKKEDLQLFLESHSLHFLYGGEKAYLLSEYKQAIQETGFKLLRSIGPLESVINYAPITKAQFKDSVISALARRLGRELASPLAFSKIIQQIYGQYASSKMNIPGRHYSFMAIKQ
ncbi:class I SAM-dependent methyltransferase [Calothrix membranacea FACHB-236]|nr:class I SAM-dependent methyltransferase [Calothrix membranacea FACHB-236]